MLLVIGILIDVQINTWNENRKIKKQEFLHLERLKRDLLQDMIYYTQRIGKDELYIESNTKSIQTDATELVWPT